MIELWDDEEESDIYDCGCCKCCGCSCDWEDDDED